MIILPENLFQGITGPDPSFLGISPDQARNNGDAIIASAGWYNQIGRLMSSGDLSVADLINIQGGIKAYGFGPFIVIPRISNTPFLPTMSTQMLAERCAFIVHPLFLYVLDPRYRWMEYGYASVEKNPEMSAKFYSLNRREAHNLIASLTLQ